MKEIYDLAPFCISGYEPLPTVQAKYDASFVEGVRTNEFMNEDVMNALRQLHEDDPNTTLMETSDTFGNVPVAIFYPESRPDTAPCLIWFHGGGLIAGTYLQDYYFGRYIADTAGCVVVSVEYRLAPEHPFPDGVNDGFNVLSWLAQADAPANFVASQFAIGGVSGGVPFATGTVLKANKGTGPKACFQLLHTPMLDHRSMSESINFTMDAGTWSRNNNRAAWDLYLARIREAGEQVPGEASPTVEEDYSNFPPTYLSIGDVDCFRDESIEFARGLARAGVPVELHMYPQCSHGLDVAVPEGHEFKERCRQEYAQVLSRAFNQS